MNFFGVVIVITLTIGACYIAGQCFDYLKQKNLTGGCQKDENDH